MISISSISIDNNDYGNVIIKDYIDNRENQSRLNRYSTLDGGTVITHSGVTEGDRIIKINSSIDKSDSNKLWDMFKTETFFLISIPDGVFLSSIKSLKLEPGIVKATIYIKNKESE